MPKTLDKMSLRWSLMVLTECALYVNGVCSVIALTHHKTSLHFLPEGCETSHPGTVRNQISPFCRHEAASIHCGIVNHFLFQSTG